QASVGREVAVKVIRPEFANRTDFVKRFEAEAQFIAQLEHPHIVSLYDYWRDQDGAYLAMQLLRGGSLATSLERSPWRPPAALHLLDQIGVALDYAHRHGVVHRDLKPANVLLDEEGNAYLTDFGIATEHVEAVGLPIESSAAYVSPEELAGAAVGAAADVYGLALLTYEILTGERPELGGQPESVSRRRHDLPAALDEVLARATDVDPNRRYERVEDYLRALRQVFGIDVVGTRPSSPTVEVRNPFKGLRAFGETDARDFYGREALIDDLIKHVAANRLTAVVGPSGSGKSSLVRAGLLPAVRRGALGIDGDVLITEMFPGSFPFEELEAALLRIAVKGQEGLLSDLTSDDRGLLRVSKQILPNDDSELLVVIDQFEELFSLTTDERTRRQFLACLVTAVSDGRGRIRVVVTMRADYFDRPLADPEFGSLLGPALIPVAMPTREELSVSIAKPAAAAGLELEDGLVPRIVGDVVGQPGALPLLQYSLTELVGQRDRERLTIDGYERTGGVSGALTARAEEIYQGFAGPARDVAREVFLRLVAVDEDADDTRRRVRRSELDALGLNESALNNVLDEYGSFRLLSFDRDPVTRGPTIEVAHEALIREWPRYREWVDERREDLLLERRLEVASTEWDSNDRDPSFLFTGGRLEQYELWSESIDTRLTETERVFLDDGRDAEDESRAATRSRRRRVLGVVSALAVVAALFAVVAIVQRNEADDKAALAEQESDRAQQSADRAAEEEQNALDAAALASEETLRADDAAAQSDELRSEAEQTAQVNLARSLAVQATAAAEGSDEDLALLLAIAASEQIDQAGVDDNEVPEVMTALHDATRAQHAIARFDVSPRAVLPQPTAVSTSVGPVGTDQIVALTPAGPTSSVAQVEILDLRTGEPVLRLDGIDDPTSVYWEHSTNEILVSTENGKISVWDPDSGTEIRTTDTGGLDVSVMDTSGPYIGYRTQTSGSGINGTIIVQDRDTGTIVIETAPADFVRLSPSGSFAVVWDERGEMHVHDLPSGDELFTREGPDVGWLNFDWVVGEDALWQSSDAGFTKIDLATGDESQPAASGDSRGTVGASPDGNWIASAWIDGVVRIFATGSEPFTQEFALDSLSGAPWKVEWLPDSTGLVAVGGDSNAVVWDIRPKTTAIEAIWPTPTYAVDTVFLDDGLMSLSGPDGGGVLWDAAAGESVAQFQSGPENFPILSSQSARIAGSLGNGVGLVVGDMARNEIVFESAVFDLPLALSS
ncbi:MAG: protein kinase, partial [Actinobacteria bacterium]|nr:protein kinase [Actinomycetota bacterium]